ncbi:MULTISPECIES: hypothetical protein [unclassified Bifidobacterium]|uniref:hypothetical protein n=1 Tax=unclassified Bifidobacterium TaxID=2608897 RepID=UPI003F8D90FA
MGADGWLLVKGDGRVLVRADHQQGRRRLPRFDVLGSRGVAFLVIKPNDWRRVFLVGFEAQAGEYRVEFAGESSLIGDGIVPAYGMYDIRIPAERRVESVDAIRLPGGQPGQFDYAATASL